MAVNVTKMSLLDFIEIPDNPRQRDTIRHATKALKKHLSKPSETHSVVAIATINGVPVCKLDGHTRCYLWETGQLKAPRGLTVMAYEVVDLDHASKLYVEFDSAFAVEVGTDKLFGACRESGIILSSGLLSGHNFNTALKCAHTLKGGGTHDEYEIVQLWKPAITIVDSWQLPKNPFKGSGLLALMFVSVASQEFPEDSIQEFFVRFANGLGEKIGKKKDGVQALEEHMSERRLKNQMTGYENIFDMMSKGYSCLFAWSRNNFIVNVQPSREALISMHAKAINNLKKGLV